jgi:hypothetical protein
MLGMNLLRAIAGGRRSAKKPETAVGPETVATAGVRRMYAFANTLDPRLVKLLKLVEQVRSDLLRQGRFFDRRSG